MTVKMTDGELVKFAVFEMGLKITGRRRYTNRCGGCRQLIVIEKWREHRCNG